MTSLETANGLCRTLADPSRVRLLALIESAALTVAELVRITGVSQSRVSTHLARLKDAGLADVTKAGTSSLFSASADRMAEPARSLWRQVRTGLDDPLLEADASRLAVALAARAKASSWADTVAGHMERHYSPGRTWEATARAFAGINVLGEVLDVASGDGALAELVAPHAKRFTCLDVSEDVARAGRRRLERFENATFVVGDMHALPFDDARFDQVLLLNALSYAKRPKAVLSEVSRVLRDGGRLTLVTLSKHGHQDIAAAYGHENQGFGEAHLTRLLGGADLQIAQRSSMAEKRAPHFEVVTIHAQRRDRT